METLNVARGIVLWQKAPEIGKPRFQSQQFYRQVVGFGKVTLLF